MIIFFNNSHGNFRLKETCQYNITLRSDATPRQYFTATFIREIRNGELLFAIVDGECRVGIRKESIMHVEAITN